MKERVQDKINQIRALAAKQEGHYLAKKEATSSDSLLQSIRNKREADIFIAELNAAFKVAGAKKK